MEAQRYDGNSSLTSLRNEEIWPVTKQTKNRVCVFPASVLAPFFTAPRVDKACYLYVKVKGKCKIYPVLCHEVTEEVQLHVFLNLDARRRRWSASRPGRFTSRKTDPVPQVQQVWWASGPVWTGAENPSHAGFRNQNLPIRIEYINDCAILAVIFK